MNKPTYQVQEHEENLYYFMSIGTKGIILKMVELSEIRPNVYNLGFGDYNFSKNIIDDKVESKNGDAEKVLATVFGILSQFLSDNPTKSVSISGSTPLRTRLYQMIVNTYIDEFSQSFDIRGGVGHEFEPFQKNKTYESFLVKKLL
jgi:hypothetical protein